MIYYNLVVFNFNVKLKKDLNCKSPDEEKKLCLEVTFQVFKGTGLSRLKKAGMPPARQKKKCFFFIEDQQLR